MNGSLADTSPRSPADGETAADGREVLERVLEAKPGLIIHSGVEIPRHHNQERFSQVEVQCWIDVLHSSVYRWMTNDASVRQLA